MCRVRRITAVRSTGRLVRLTRANRQIGRIVRKAHTKIGRNFPDNLNREIGRDFRQTNRPKIDRPVVRLQTKTVVTLSVGRAAQRDSYLCDAPVVTRYRSGRRATYAERDTGRRTGECSKFNPRRPTCNLPQSRSNIVCRLFFCCDVLNETDRFQFVNKSVRKVCRYSKLYLPFEKSLFQNQT